MRDKIALTQKLLEQLGPDHGISVEQARVAWWYNIRPNGGMRLTNAGYVVFVELLQLESYTYDIGDDLYVNQKTLLDLDRKLQMPYYVVLKKNMPVRILFFGGKEAVMAQLYGDLERFLKNL